MQEYKSTVNLYPDVKIHYIKPNAVIFNNPIDVNSKKMNKTYSQAYSKGRNFILE